MNTLKKSIYFIIQGKGGVGKTLISSYLMQYLQEQNQKNKNKKIKQKVKGIDTDPNNRSFKNNPNC